MDEIFFGNLADGTTSDELRKLVEDLGIEVRRARIPADEDGRPRPYGFVRIWDPKQRAIAIAELDGSEWRGRPLRVNAAKERGAR